MQTVLHLGDRPITLNQRDWDEDIDVDQLCSIDYSNLYGEAVTVPALLNQVGILKAMCEKEYSMKKMEFDVFEAELRQRLRKSAVQEGIKMTENGLNELVEIDEGFRIKKKNVITSKYNLDIADSMFWAINSKNKKLDVLVKGVTPEELFNELIEGTINNVVVKKHKSIIEKSKENGKNK